MNYINTLCSLGILLWKPRIFIPPTWLSGYIGNFCTEPLGPWMVKAAMTCALAHSLENCGCCCQLQLPGPTSGPGNGHSIASAVSSPAMSESSSDGPFSRRRLIEKDFLMASRSPRGEKDVLGHHLTEPQSLLALADCCLPSSVQFCSKGNSCLRLYLIRNF